MKKIILKTVRAVFAIFIVFVLCLRTYEIADKVSGKFLSGGIVFTVLFGMAFLVAAFVILLICVRYQEKLRRFVSGIPAWKMAVFLFIFTVTIRLVFACLIPLDASMHPDMGTYRHMGTELSAYGQVTASAGYAANYPYTLNYVLFLYPAFKLLGGSLFAVSAYLTLWSAVSLTLFFVTLKEYAGKNISFVGLLLFSLIPSEIIFVQYTIHEHTLALAGAVVFWLIFKRARFSGKKSVRLACYLGSLAILSLEFRINKLALVLMLALFIYSFYAMLKERVTIKSAAAFCSGFLAVALTFLITGAVLPALHAHLLPQDAKSEKMISAGLWEYYVGLDNKSGGQWSEESYNAYYRYSDPELPDYGTKTEQEVYEYQKELFNGRAREYMNNPIRYVVLVSKKCYYMWASCGYGYNQSWLIKNENLINSLDSCHVFEFEALAVTFANLVFAFTILFSLSRKKTAEEDPAIYLKMLLLGTTCVLMLVEVSPKYTYAFTLPLVSIAILEYRNAYEHITAITNRIGRKIMNK